MCKKGVQGCIATSRIKDCGFPDMSTAANEKENKAGGNGGKSMRKVFT